MHICTRSTNMAHTKRNYPFTSEKPQGIRKEFPRALASRSINPPESVHLSSLPPTDVKGSMPCTPTPHTALRVPSPLTSAKPYITTSPIFFSELFLHTSSNLNIFPPSSSSSCFPINISAPTSMLHFSHLPTSSRSTWPHCPHKVPSDLYFANSKIYYLVGTNLLDHSFPPEKRAFPDSGFLIFFYFSVASQSPLLVCLLLRKFQHIFF